MGILNWGLNGDLEQGTIQFPHSKLFSFLVIVNYVHEQVHQSLLFKEYHITLFCVCLTSRFDNSILNYIQCLSCLLR